MLKKFFTTIQTKLYLKLLLGICAALILFIGVSIYLIRQNIGTIFNEIAARQMVLKGQLTVEDITADWDGCVFFENLVWVDNTGKTAAQIPRGSFRVSLWDLMTRNFTPASIKLINLQDAKISITFNERMAIQSIDRRKIAKPKPKPKTDDTVNIHIDKYDLNAQLILKDCTLEAFYEQRHFLMYDVNAYIDIDTKKAIKGSFSTGFFGGTISADGLEIDGEIDFTKPVHEYNLTLVLKEVNPSTLGAGIGMYEPVSATAKMTGPLPNPTISGSLTMHDLILTGLHLTDLTGKFNYQNGLITAHDVKAKAFDGDVSASGYFNIDKRTYMIDIVGKYLKSQLAGDKELICLVDLTAKMQGFGDPKSVLTTGSFKSSGGVYKGIPFKSIGADVHNQYGIMEFNNVVVKTPLISFSTSIVVEKGQFRLGKVARHHK